MFLSKINDFSDVNNISFFFWGLLEKTWGKVKQKGEINEKRIQSIKGNKQEKEREEKNIFYFNLLDQ